MQPPQIPDYVQRAALEASALWSMEGQPRLIKRLENYTFAVTSKGIDYILRITEQSHRSVEQIQAELHWIEFLASHGLRVSEPLPSVNGRFIESFGTEARALHTALFRKASGRPFDMKQDWTPEFHRNLGQTIGRMHALTKTYQPSQGAVHRPHWHQAPVFTHPERYLPKSDTIAWQEFNEVMEWAKSLPTSSDAYGLVHTDLNQSNYFVDEAKRLTVFDFDDCEYHWFAMDLAIPLFYFMYYENLPTQRANSDDWFYDRVLNAYLAENTLSDEWIRRIPAFVRFRRIDLYLFIHKEIDVVDLSENEQVMFQRMRRDFQIKEPLL